MAGDQQKPLTALSQAGNLAAVVYRLCYCVSVVDEELLDLLEQVTAAAGQPGYVLEYDQLDRVILPRLQHQPDAAQRQLVERLVLGCQA